MIVYDGTKANFLKSVEAGTIAEEVYNNVLAKMGRHTGKSEFDSWDNSMMNMHLVLSDPQIPNNAGIAIEYNIPQTSKRVDFIISGYDEKNQPNAVIIELKQWSKVEKVDGPDALVNTYTGGANRTVVHPSYQVWSYASLIRDYNQSVQDNEIDLAPCVFLHNYSINKQNDPILAPQYQTYIVDAPVFSKHDALKLRAFIKRFVKIGDNKDILYSIDHGKIRPSKSLQNSIASMLQGNKEFIMIDDQKVAYENILATSMKCMEDGKKRTVIVQGGPGTGKSVIAINLLAELTQRGQIVQYASKNSAPRAVYAQKLKGQLKKSSIDNLFKGTGMYTELDSDVINTILVDEAHRMNAKSGMFHNLGENQIKEVIHASFCSVFFIDESQRVTMDDIGSVAEIKKWAHEENSEVIELALTSQFRCNGSDGYLAWIDDVLEIRETGNYDLDGIDYDIRVLDTPNEVRDLIIKKNNENHRSRMLAGYCWDWIASGKNDTNVHDIVIGDFAMSWNLGNTIFAVDDTSIDQIGCIHTSQGLEFDYVGVIIGDDMRYSNDHIVTDYTKRAKTDQSMKGIKKLAKEDKDEANARGDEIIKNTYRTLLTRGMKGCYVYCTDPSLRDYLRRRLQLSGKPSKKEYKDQSYLLASEPSSDYNS